MKLTIVFLLAALGAFAQPDGATNTTPPAPGQSQTNPLPPSVLLAEQLRAACIKGRRSICGRILRVLPEGMVVECGYTNLLREPLTKSWLVPGTVTASRATNLIEANEPNALCVGTVFLTDLPKGRGAKPHEYDYVILCGYPAGQQTYTSVGDLRKTVRRFSASLEKAVKINFAAAQEQPPDHPAGVK